MPLTCGESIPLFSLALRVSSGDARLAGFKSSHLLISCQEFEVAGLDQFGAHR
jgi:hypothetical protein